MEKTSELYLIPALQQLFDKLPFKILGFHSDNGREYVNSNERLTYSESITGYYEFEIHFVEEFCASHLHLILFSRPNAPYATLRGNCWITTLTSKIIVVIQWYRGFAKLWLGVQNLVSNRHQYVKNYFWNFQIRH